MRWVAHKLPPTAIIMLALSRLLAWHPTICSKHDPTTPLSRTSARLPRSPDQCGPSATRRPALSRIVHHLDRDTTTSKHGRRARGREPFSKQCFDPYARSSSPTSTCTRTHLARSVRVSKVMLIRTAARFGGGGFDYCSLVPHPALPALTHLWAQRRTKTTPRPSGRL